MNPVPYLTAPEEFRGKVAVVTGGTAGLGRHLTQALVKLGAIVYFCARDPAPGQELSRELGSAARFISLDLRDPDAVASFINAAGTATNAIDYLVNNAAIDPRMSLEEGSIDDFDRLIDINLRPHFLTAKFALPFLRRGDGKAIVNIATTNYMLGLTPFTIYNASKSGIIGLTRSLARELGPFGIRANVVSPGWIMTPLQLRKHVTAQDQAELIEAQALKFLLTEVHVTPLTLFLLSSAAAAITGQNIVVDGGKMMQ